MNTITLTLDLDDILAMKRAGQSLIDWAVSQADINAITPRTYVPEQPPIQNLSNFNREELSQHFTAPPPPTELDVDDAPQTVDPSPTELDVDGIPWDHRIHASTKTKTAKDQWKRKRGVDDKDYNAIIAELKGVMAIPAPAPAPAPATVVDNGAPTNFIGFLTAITTGLNDKSLKQKDVDAAIASVGLPGLSLVGGRPDLIPAIWDYLYSAKAKGQA